MIALSSELSRRAAEKAIAAGEVAVNGQVVTELGTVVDPAADRVSLRGALLTLSPRRHYLAFHKPRNCIVSKSDPQGRPTIWNYLESWKAKLNAVGRLDFDSDGLLLLTDDGDFVNRLTHPRHEIWKVYRARVKGVPGPSAMKRLADGIGLADGRTLPARVRRVGGGEANAIIEIAIREGKNRQVRRMFDAVGCPVMELTRIAVGPVKLGSLGQGKWRELTSAEVEALLATSR